MTIFLRGGTPVAAGTLDVSAMKAKQSAKIREIRHALISEGFATLDQQAKALGLGRSTAWTILRAMHKASGISATIINRILVAPHLPALVRLKVLEYVEEKAVGLYGQTKAQQRRFVARLTEGCREDESLFGLYRGMKQSRRASDRERGGQVARNGGSTFHVANGDGERFAYSEALSDVDRPFTVSDSRSGLRSRAVKTASSN